MEAFKKNFDAVKRCLLSLVFLMATTFPTFASLNKGESFVLQGKFDEAVEVLEPFADKNDPRALYLMAVIYLSPHPHFHNPQKGLELLQKAVFQNYAPALDELAGLYLVGENVKKDEAKALHYYIQGSHMGYGPSQFNCGIMYKNGQGTNQDFVKSYLYLTLASLNHEHLGEVAHDAAKYRDELAPLLSPMQRQDTSRRINALVP